MSEKRFIVDYEVGVLDTKTNKIICDTVSADEVVDLLNELNDENKTLKAQLLYDGDDVCDICKHEYLTPSGNYFIGKCEKGHEECSKEDINYCEDFKLKEC